MKETDLQHLFRQWIKKNLPKESQVYEFKICKEKSLPYHNVQPHQEYYLKKAKENGLYHKISDAIPGIKPFDALFIRPKKAFVVIMFYIPHKPKETYLIEIDNWIKYKEQSKRKSITKEECENIKDFKINL